jgi:hypothetical protein
LLESTLEVANASPAECCPFGQFRLSQAARPTVPAKEFGKRRLAILARLECYALSGDATRPQHGRRSQRMHDVCVSC